jgi:hypothetical protein
MEKLNKIPCKLKVNKTNELKELVSTDLFPLAELDPKDVEFKLGVGEDRVRVYIK